MVQQYYTPKTNPGHFKSDRSYESSHVKNSATKLSARDQTDESQKINVNLSMKKPQTTRSQANYSNSGVKDPYSSQNSSSNRIPSPRENFNSYQAQQQAYPRSLQSPTYQEQHQKRINFPQNNLPQPLKIKNSEILHEIYDLDNEIQRFVLYFSINILDLPRKLLRKNMSILTLI